MIISEWNLQRKARWPLGLGSFSKQVTVLIHFNYKSHEQLLPVILSFYQLIKLLDVWSVSLCPSQPPNLFISESKMTRGKKGQQVCLFVRPRKSVAASEFDWTCVECQISFADKEYMTVALESLLGLKGHSGHANQRKKMLCKHRRWKPFHIQVWHWDYTCPLYCHLSPHSANRTAGRNDA